MKARRFLSLLLSVLMLSGLLAATAFATEDVATGVAFPLEEPVTLTMWAPFNTNASTVMSDFNGSVVFQEMEKITGVKIEFVHPAMGQEAEQFNLMIASQEYPDMIMGAVQRYPGGGDRAVEDGVILKLNDLIAANAPNYSKILAENSQAAKETTSDTGVMPAIYPLMRQNNLCWYGPSIRKDWLEETGLDVPVTLEDWEAVLTAMKENHPEATPLVFHPGGSGIGETFGERGVDNWGLFLTAFGVGPRLYNDGGTVKLGPIEEEFKPYLEMMSRWYANGLIDPDFPARDQDGVNALITSGGAGAMVGSVDVASNLFGSQGFEYVTAPYPVLNAGDTIEYRAFDAVASPIASAVSVSTQCKNPDIAVAWLDYAFSEPGSLLYNFGIEGETYTLVDGEPQFTDKMLNNPDYPSETLLYLLKMQVFPQLRYGAYANPGTVQNPAVMEQKIAWTEQCGTEMTMPPLTLTADEAKEYSNIMNTADVYRNEMVIKFIMGVEPLENFDSYVEQLKTMGIEKAIGIYQDAMDRFMTR